MTVVELRVNDVCEWELQKGNFVFVRVVRLCIVEKVVIADEHVDTEQHVLCYKYNWYYNFAFDYVFYGGFEVCKLYFFHLNTNNYIYINNDFAIQETHVQKR